MKIMVAYDGTLQSKEALHHGLVRARETNGEMIALQVFDPRLFIDYDLAPNEREAARGEFARQLDEAKTIIRQDGAGVRAALFSAEGAPDEMILSVARQEHVDVLLCPPRFHSIIRTCCPTGPREADSTVGSGYQACSMS